jgi:hypothetical protein
MIHKKMKNRNYNKTKWKDDIGWSVL